MDKYLLAVVLLFFTMILCGCGQEDVKHHIAQNETEEVTDTITPQVPVETAEFSSDGPPAPSERAFQPPAPEDELSLEEAKWLAVGRYTPRGLGYSPEDMWQKTDYLELNATGTFTSYMEAGGLMIGRNEKYVSGTWEVVSAKEDRITLRAKYNEEGFIPRETLWTVHGK
jgi:hypothetical protein